MYDHRNHSRTEWASQDRFLEKMMFCVRSLLFCSLMLSSVQTLAHSADKGLPDESAYVTMKNGDLYLGGKRVCFWGGIGGFPPRPPRNGKDPYAHNRLMLERIKAYGFNMMRIWGYGRA
ncbi:MAG: hypothetical protein D6820_03785, partial [Lentisphaerae bacterium]